MQWFKGGYLDHRFPQSIGKRKEIEERGEEIEEKQWGKDGGDWSILMV